VPSIRLIVTVFCPRTLRGRSTGFLALPSAAKPMAQTAAVAIARDSVEFFIIIMFLG
jgi:hypothetical protein